MRPLRAAGFAARYGDALVALGLAAFSVVESRTAGRFDGPTWADVGLAVLAAAPLASRRSQPLAVLVMILALTDGYAAAWGLPQSAGVLLVVILAVYSLPRHRTGRVRVVGAVLAAGAVLFAEWRDPSTHSVAEAMPTFLLVAAAWVAGVAARRSADRSRQLSALSEQLRAEKEETARLAVVSERLHIARELHDVLAHSVSVMVVQVGAARLAAGTLPRAADTALRSAEQVGRQSLADMRRLLTVLRDDPDQLLLPQPGVAALPELIAASAPLAELHLDLTLPELPPGLDLVVYRIVQEAITNIVKHAPGAPAAVHISHTGDGVRVVIDNSAPPVAARPAAASPGSGHGLAGMVERAAMYGGQVTAEPRPDGGFQVCAFLPFQPAEGHVDANIS